MIGKTSPVARKIQVLVVDDSASVRQSLKQILESDPEIEVMGVACDPYAAVEHIRRRVPDVMTLDVEMPRMDGLTFLEKIMEQHPIPVVICSTLTEGNSDTALAALQKGAVEIITKPKMGTKEFFEESRVQICDVVKSAAQARLRNTNRRRAVMQVSPKLTADAIMPPPGSRAMIQTTDESWWLAPPPEERKHFVNFSRRCRSMRLPSSSCSTCRNTLRPVLPNV